MLSEGAGIHIGTAASTMSVTGKVKKSMLSHLYEKTPKIVGNFCSKRQAGDAFVIFCRSKLAYWICISTVRERMMTGLCRSRNEYGRPAFIKSNCKFFPVIKPTRCINFTNLFWKETLHVSDSSYVHYEEFLTVHTAMIYVIRVC
jgi:hypothetical protein